MIYQPNALPEFTEEQWFAEAKKIIVPVLRQGVILRHNKNYATGLRMDTGSGKFYVRLNGAWVRTYVSKGQFYAAMYQFIKSGL